MVDEAFSSTNCTSSGIYGAAFGHWRLLDLRLLRGAPSAGHGARPAAGRVCQNLLIPPGIAVCLRGYDSPTFSSSCRTNGRFFRLQDMSRLTPGWPGSGFCAGPCCMHLSVLLSALYFYHWPRRGAVYPRCTGCRRRRRWQYLLGCRVGLAT